MTIHCLLDELTILSFDIRPSPLISGAIGSYMGAHTMDHNVLSPCQLSLHPTCWPSHSPRVQVHVDDVGYDKGELDREEE